MANKNGSRIAHLAPPPATGEIDQLTAAEHERLAELLDVQEAAGIEVQLFVLQLRKAYKLREGDQIDRKTGKLTRA